jgi:FkbM family methyltransferase
MKLHDKIEDTLGGHWPGLHGEVVTHDCYRLRSLDFVPEVVFDIGANVGTFTRFARGLWPKAQIVAVEPDPENAAHFRRFALDAGVELIEKAIGRKEVYRCAGAANGSGEVYMSPGLGYPRYKILKNPQMSLAVVPTLSLADVIKPRWSPKMKYVLKLDCEGAENSIWTHPQSMTYLSFMDYVAMEIHRYAMDGGEQEEVNMTTEASLSLLRSTHVVERAGVHVWARKR